MTRKRVLMGWPARAAGFVCAAASVAYYWWMSRMWSLYDR